MPNWPMSSARARLVRAPRTFSRKSAGAGIGDGAERAGQILARHADAIILDGQRAALLVQDHPDRERFAVAQQGWVAVRLVTKLFAGVRGVGNQLAKERCRAPNRSNEPSDAAGAPHPPGKHGVRFRSSPNHASFFVPVLKFNRTRRWPPRRNIAGVGRCFKGGAEKFEPAGKCRPAHVASRNVGFGRRSGWGAASTRQGPNPRSRQDRKWTGKTAGKRRDSGGIMILSNPKAPLSRSCCSLDMRPARRFLPCEPNIHSKAIRRNASGR